MATSNKDSLNKELSQDGKKKLLIRSNAMCDDGAANKGEAVEPTSPISSFRPPDLSSSFSLPSSSVQQRQKHLSAASTLSRDSTATDYTDTTGIDLLQFVVNTLHKNLKDREMLLSLEAEMRKFVLDQNRIVYKFPKMSSYNRMLVHRVAAFFGLNHNIDQSGTLVVVNKTPQTRLPDIEFSKCIRNNLFTDRVLNRRSVQSFDECRLRGSNFQPIQPLTAIYYDGNAQPILSPNDGLALNNSSVSPTTPNFQPQHSPLDSLIRRARSFEVGEWHNSMAQNAANFHLPSRSRTNQSSGGSWQQLPLNNGGFMPAGSQSVTDNPQQFLQRSDSLCRPSGTESYFMVDPNLYPSRSHHVSGSSIPGRNSSLLIHSTTNSVDQSQDSGCFDNSALIKSATNEEIEEGIEGGDTTAPSLEQNQPLQPGTFLYPIQWVDGSVVKEQPLLYDPNLVGYYPPVFSPSAQQVLYVPQVPAQHQPRYFQLANADPQMQYYQQLAAPPAQYISSDGRIISPEMAYHQQQQQLLLSEHFQNALQLNNTSTMLPTAAPPNSFVQSAPSYEGPASMMTAAEILPISLPPPNYVFPPPLLPPGAMAPFQYVGGNPQQQFVGLTIPSQQQQQYVSNAPPSNSDYVGPSVPTATVQQQMAQMLQQQLRQRGNNHRKKRQQQLR